MKKFLSDCPVPIDQQPMNEYLNLKDSIFFFWTTKDIKIYIKYTISTALAIYSLTIFLIINSNPQLGTINQIDTLIYMYVFGGFILSIYFIRLYLGWLYVYERLIKSSVSYEESGWYDGQIWVKTPNILIQDKLIAEYQILPILHRLKVTLLSFMSSVILGTIYIYT
jgi:hypothetical protein